MPPSPATMPCTRLVAAVLPINGKKGSYTQGVQEGAFCRFDQQGKRIEEGQRLNGKPDGLFRHYKNDLLQKCTFFKEGQPDNAMDKELIFPGGRKKADWCIDRYYQVRKLITGKPSPITNMIRNGRRLTRIECKFEKEISKRVQDNARMTGCKVTANARDTTKPELALVSGQVSWGRDKWRRSALMGEPEEHGNERPVGDVVTQPMIFTPVSLEVLPSDKKRKLQL